MSSSRNYATALNLVWAARVDDDTPHPDTLEVFAALGLVDLDEYLPAGGWRTIVPDDETPVSLDDRGSRVPRLEASPAPTRRDEKLNRSLVPPGLRDLSPETAKPPRVPAVTKPAEGDRTRAEQPVRRPKAPPARKAVPAKRPAAVKPANRKRPGRPPGPIPHGTPAGYRAHYRRGELPVCDACRDVYNAEKRCQDAARRARVKVEKAKREGPARIAVELDVWFADAQRSEHPQVRRACAVAVSALMALRVAMDDLARAERHAAACSTTTQGVA